MKVTVNAPFLPRNIAVEVDDEITIKDLFVEAQRISSCEENLDRVTKDFRIEWYFFFKDRTGFEHWSLLEVKEVNGTPEPKAYPTDGRLPLKDMDCTLNNLKLSWNLLEEVNSLNIDIGTPRCFKLILIFFIQLAMKRLKYPLLMMMFLQPENVGLLLSNIYHSYPKFLLPTLLRLCFIAEIIWSAMIRIHLLPTNIHGE